MSKFYKIQIGDLHLSSDGTTDNDPCKLQITGFEDLLVSVTGNATASITGEPIFQTFQWTAGKPFEIRVGRILTPVWTDLLAMINDSLENDTDYEINGTGEPGAFSVDARFNPQKPFSIESFASGRVKGVTLSLITV